MQKNSINEKKMQRLRIIAVLCVVHDIEMQAHWIFIKQNFLAHMLSRGQYIKIAHRYPYIHIAKSIFETSLKAGI